MQVFIIGNPTKTHLGLCVGTFLLFGLGCTRNAFHLNFACFTLFIVIGNTFKGD